MGAFDEIKEKAEDAKEKAKHAAEDLKEKAEDLRDNIKDRLNREDGPGDDAGRPVSP
jgi:uncharacterized protein YjbJ (UPF0337 family)